MTKSMGSKNQNGKLKLSQPLQKILADRSRKPAANSAALIQSFNSNIFGMDEIDFEELMEGLNQSSVDLSKGDYSVISDMLLCQATALQTMFTSLARQANGLTHLNQIDALMKLALKSQSQSRTTLLALVQHLSPKRVAFVKQANIAHGPQQVNNQHQDVQSITKNLEKPQNKLLEESTYERTKLDLRAKTEAERSHSPMEAMGALYGPQER